MNKKREIQQTNELEKIKALFVSRAKGEFLKFSRMFSDFLPHATLDHAKTLFQAIKKQPDGLYDLIFITAEFSLGEANEFFNDMKLVKHSESCIFCRVYEKEPSEYEIDEDIDCGFDVSITAALSNNDKELLMDALLNKAPERKRKAASLKVESNIQVLLREIDSVVNDMGRGYERKIRSVADRIIEHIVKEDEALLDAYYEALLQHSLENKSPAQVIELCIPEEVLAKKLPKLNEQGYSGASSRVWQALINKFAKSQESDPNNPENPEQLEASPEK